jgi:hypothetical protein
MKHAHAKDSHNGREISEILRTLPDHLTRVDTSIGELKEALSGRAYGILLLVLALPNLIPIPAPGLSLLLGTPLLWITFQLMFGLQTPWFPNFIAKRTMKTAYIHAVCRRIVPSMQKIERVISPRLMFLTAPPVDRLVALICAILSLMIMMPIPFGNAFPALAICFFAIGILQRDGVFIILGLTITIISTAVIGAFLGTLAFSVVTLFSL